MFPDPSLVLAGILFFLIVFFGLKYSKRLSQVSKEYRKAKETVKDLVITINNRQKQQIEKIAYNMEAIHSTTERLMKRIEKQEGKINYLTANVKEAWAATKKLADRIVFNNKKLEEIEKNQRQIQHQLTVLNEKYNGLLPETEAKMPIPIEDRKMLGSLTETDAQILQILALEGPRSATEMSKIIKKTREHTSRTMRKLYDLGYVNRDTHKFPYVYTVNKKLQKKLEEVIKNTGNQSNVTV